MGIFSGILDLSIKEHFKMDAGCILLVASPSKRAHNFTKEFGKENITDNCHFPLKPRLAWTWHPMDDNHWLHPNIEKGQEQRGAHEGQPKFESTFICIDIRKSGYQNIFFYRVFFHWVSPKSKSREKLS